MAPTAAPMAIARLVALRSLLSLYLFTAPDGADALHAYGHAYSRPNDFTDDQIEAVASRFEVFTVEKVTAENHYGRNSSIAATVGTAKRIKALNSSVKVLMYWNAALNYGSYECESEVDPSWIHMRRGKRLPYYNYSVPAFREWWVRCAVDAIQGAGAGVLDGLFLDATPKVASGQCGGASKAAAMASWKGMVDELRSALGPDAIIMDNGFFLGGRYPHNKQYAGADSWVHTGARYAESLSRIGTGAKSPDQDVDHMRWLANASLAHPTLQLIGHGNINSKAIPTPPQLDPVFEFGLAKYMLVTSSMAEGWFLANDGGYSIDGGLLAQPLSVYTNGGLGCGEPTAALVREGGESSYLLTRRFEHGTVAVDVKAGTATIKCGSAAGVEFLV